MTATIVALGLVIAAFAVARSVRAWWVARDVAERLPVGPSGIIEGAEPIVRERAGAREAVLLLHGFGDTPQTLSYLADELHARGWDVHAPLLPGHGRTLRSFASSRSQQWVGAAREALDYLLARYKRVAVVGLSMGGALAAILAAERDRVVALALLAPYVELPPRLRRLVRHHQMIHVLTPVLRGNNERSILDPAERTRSLGYRAMTPTLARELSMVAERARGASPDSSANPARSVAPGQPAGVRGGRPCLCRSGREGQGAPLARGRGPRHHRGLRPGQAHRNGRRMAQAMGGRRRCQLVRV